VRVKQEWIDRALAKGACTDEVDLLRAGMSVHDVPQSSLMWAEDVGLLSADETAALSGLPLFVLSDGYGYGSGYGYGYGSGSGYSYGYGSGSGSGYSYGDGDGSGSGYSYGDGDGDGYSYGYGSGYGYGYGSG